MMDPIKTYEIKEEELAKTAYATIKTNKGNIALELFYKRQRPKRSVTL